MHKLNLAESISKTSDSSKNNNIFGSHKGELKKTKALIIMGLILIMSACFILYLYSQGVRWVHVSSGAEESPFMIIGASIFCIFLGLWFIIDYFKESDFHEMNEILVKINKIANTNHKMSEMYNYLGPEINPKMYNKYKYLDKGLNISSTILHITNGIEFNSKLECLEFIKNKRSKNV